MFKSNSVTSFSSDQLNATAEEGFEFEVAPYDILGEHARVGREVPESCWFTPTIKTESTARLPIVGQKSHRILLGHTTNQDRNPSKISLSWFREVPESGHITNGDRKETETLIIEMLPK